MQIELLATEPTSHRSDQSTTRHAGAETATLLQQGTLVRSAAAVNFRTRAASDRRLN